MLAVTGAIARPFDEWLGLGFQWRGWFNLDLIWVATLAATGLILIL